MIIPLEKKYRRTLSSVNKRFLVCIEEEEWKKDSLFLFPSSFRGGRNIIIITRIVQDSASAPQRAAHAHQLGGLNHRRGISNSTDYVLITLVGIAKNVEWHQDARGVGQGRKEKRRGERERWPLVRRRKKRESFEVFQPLFNLNANKIDRCIR